MNASRFQAITRSHSQLRIALIGDFCLDRYLEIDPAKNEVSIETGRTHQIRVHAAHAGHPVAGDERYGDKDFDEYLKSFGLTRMFLHAHSLSFDWPDTGEPFNASAPLPEDLKSVLTALEVKSAKRAGGRRPAS